MAANAADSGGSPPRELVLAWQCLRWSSLPFDGGLFDQPAGLIGRMSSLLTVYNAINAASQAKNIAHFANSNPDVMRIVARVEKIRRFG